MPLLENDIGHGRNTYPPSKGVPTMAEFEFNNAVGKETKRLLQGKVPTYEAQPFDGLDVPLTKRTNLYNAQYAKHRDAIGISNHANANGKPSVRGFGVFYWHTSKEAKKLAEIILDEYKKEFPDRDQYPIWGSGLFPSVPNTWTNLHMCRETHSNFVLVEWEFMTNADALRLLKSDDYRKRCALVNAKSVCRWYGIKFEEEKPKVEPVAEKPVEIAIEKPSEDKGGRKLELNQRERTEVANLFSMAENRGVFTSREHVDLVMNGEMTESRAIYLLAAIIKRVHFPDDKK